MKLNKEKNIKLCQKALYAKQLQNYAKLCELYADLAVLQGFDATPEDVQEAYSFALSKATANDLSFIEEQPGNYSNEEMEIFRKYAFFSGRLNQFKHAANILDSAIVDHEDNTYHIDSSVINEYTEYMLTTSKSTQAFYNCIDESSPTFVGHKYYVATSNAVDRITEIDRTHLNPTFLGELSPGNFGANIVGVKPPKEVLWEATMREDPDDEINYGEEPNQFLSAAYTIGKRIPKKAAQIYTGNKKTIRATIAAVLAATALYAGIGHYNNVSTYNNLSSQTNAAQGYELYISPQTQEMLTQIKQAITACENSNETPTYEQMQDIKDNLDDVIDLVMSDLTTKAFEDRNPDCKVTNVETRYDKGVNQYATSTSEPSPEYICTIEYQNSKGEEKRVVVSNFNSLLFPDNVTKSFDNEYFLDYKTGLYTIYNNSSSSYVEKAEQISALLQSFKSVLKDTEHLAGTKLVYNNGLFIIDPSLTGSLPDKLDDKGEER